MKINSNLCLFFHFSVIRVFFCGDWIVIPLIITIRQKITNQLQQTGNNYLLSENRKPIVKIIPKLDILPFW